MKGTYKMLSHYFNQEIKPFNDKLGKALHIVMIPVREYHTTEPITVQLLTTDGDLDECNHAQSKQITTQEEFRSGEEMLSVSRAVQICLKKNCNAWTLDGVNWEN